jgi:hypothetical protein
MSPEYSRRLRPTAAASRAAAKNAVGVCKIKVCCAGAGCRETTLGEICYTAAMPSKRRDQFGLGALLTAITAVPLWFLWAESVVEHIEETKRREAAAEVAPDPQPAVVFAVH